MWNAYINSCTILHIQISSIIYETSVQPLGKKPYYVVVILILKKWCEIVVVFRIYSILFIENEKFCIIMRILWKSNFKMVRANDENQVRFFGLINIDALNIHNPISHNMHGYTWPPVPTLPCKDLGVLEKSLSWLMPLF